MKFKGPVFPSFRSQNRQRQRRVFRPNLQSERQQLRNLRKKCKSIIDSKDPEIIAVGQRVIQAVIDEPNPEFGSLHLIAAGLDASFDAGVSWTVAMDYILKKFEERSGQTVE